MTRFDWRFLLVVCWLWHGGAPAPPEDLGPFAILGLDPTASCADIKRRLRERTLEIQRGCGSDRDLAWIHSASAEAVAIKTSSMSES